jgi:hypothetical protein
MKPHGILRTAIIVSLVAASSAALAALDPEWPREYQNDKGKLEMYQPQVTSWEDFERLEARIALAFAPTGSKSPALGTMVLTAKTDVNTDEHRVRVYDIAAKSGNFPTLTEDQSKRLMNGVLGLLPEETEVELERLVANLDRFESQPQQVELKVDPPKIFVSTAPAILVVLDGKPIMSPIKDNDLKFAVNTNWDLFELAQTWYLRNEDAWYKALTLGGPWAPAGKLPKPFKKLPKPKKDPTWKDVKENMPGKKITQAQVPRVFLSEKPAELILLDSEPSYAEVPGTKLLWVDNTDSDLFLSTEPREYYYLVSGRWFKSVSLDGPWTFASLELPDDFQKFPAGHPRVQADRRHVDDLRGQHAQRRDPRGGHLLLLLPGRVVRLDVADGSVGGGRRGARRDLQHPAQLAGVPHDARQGLRQLAGLRGRRLHVRLLRRLRVVWHRLVRHRLVLPTTTTGAIIPCTTTTPTATGCRRTTTLTRVLTVGGITATGPMAAQATERVTTRRPAPTREAQRHMGRTMPEAGRRPTIPVPERAPGRISARRPTRSGASPSCAAATTGRTPAITPTRGARWPDSRPRRARAVSATPASRAADSSARGPTTTSTQVATATSIATMKTAGRNTARTVGRAPRILAKGARSRRTARPAVKPARTASDPPVSTAEARVIGPDRADRWASSSATARHARAGHHARGSPSSGARAARRDPEVVAASAADVVAADVASVLIDSETPQGI